LVFTVYYKSYLNSCLAAAAADRAERQAGFCAFLCFMWFVFPRCFAVYRKGGYPNKAEQQTGLVLFRGKIAAYPWMPA
jgi:hypothetical protein